MDIPFHADFGVVARWGEEFFSIITRQKIRRGVFKSVADLEDAIKRYVKAHNKNSTPFVWTASAASILEKLAEISEPSE